MCRALSAIVALAMVASANGEEWQRFRGNDGSGVSREKNLPAHWSAKENLRWRTKLPGPGTSSPILVNGRIYLTCYSGYGTEDGGEDMEKLRLHVVCIDRNGGKVLWTKTIQPKLPEQRYRGYLALHGYASSTPACDGERLYVFFGRTGVFCFDLDGKQIWTADVGSRTHGWGSATSVVPYKNLVIVNASVESGRLVALDKSSGKEVWTAKGIQSSWSTPVVAKAPNGRNELIVSGSRQVLAFDPDSGKPLWNAKVFNWYVCPSVVVHDGIVYALQNSVCTAIKMGGTGDVTKTHVLWKNNAGSTVPSLTYRNGYLYYPRGGRVCCMDAKSGKVIYQKGPTPNPGSFYASPLVADGKVYYISRNRGVYVVAEGPEYKLLAHNSFEDDGSRTNASPIADAGCILYRTDRYLYCTGGSGKR